MVRTEEDADGDTTEGASVPVEAEADDYADDDYESDDDGEGKTRRPSNGSEQEAAVHYATPALPKRMAAQSAKDKLTRSMSSSGLES